MALQPIACTPDEEDTLVIDGATLRSTRRGWSLVMERVLVAVHFALPEALPAARGTMPFRSPAVAYVAVAVDAFGAVHAIDAMTGTLLSSQAPVGAPVDVATSALAVAIATTDRIVIWRTGERTERKVAATAIAFGAAAVLAFATEQGVFVDDAPVDLAAAPGVVVDLAARRDGSWLAGGPRGLFATEGRLLHGTVRRFARDGLERHLAVQRSDTMIAVFDLSSSVATSPPTPTATRRIHYTDRTIVGLAFSSEGLVVALDGGRIETIDLAAWQSTHGTVEDLRARSPVIASGRIGHRRGVVAIIPVASAAALCLWTYLHHEPAPMPRFYPLPKIAPLECDSGCELERLDALVLACRDAPDMDCLGDAERAREAFGVRQCTSVELQLAVLADRAGADASARAAPVAVAIARAREGLASACLAPAPPRYQLLGFRAGAAPLSVPPPRGLTTVLALGADHSGQLYIAAALRGPERCEVYRRGSTVDTQWTTILTVSGCASADIVARRIDDVYFASNVGMMHFDGAAWSLAGVLDRDVMSAFEGRDRGWTTAEGQTFAVRGGSVERSSDRGATWVRDDIGPMKAVAGQSAVDAYAGGAGGLFHFDGKRWSRILDTPVELLAANEQETWAMIATQ